MTARLDDRATPSRPDLDEALAGAGFTQQPYPAHAGLRAEAGLRWCGPWGAWVASRHEHVAEALRRDGTELSAVGQTSVALAHLDRTDRAGLAAIETLFGAGLLWSDPPDHERIRQVVNKALNPRDLERLRPHVAALIGDTVRALPIDRPFDVVASLAAPVPVAVLAGLLGIPAADVVRVRSWADTLADFMGDPHPPIGSARAAQAVVTEACTYIDGIAHRRPADDSGVIGRLAALRAAGADLTDDEFHATVIVLLVGGHRTTAAAIANTVLALAGRPEDRARLRADPALVTTAVEESLRYESPHQRTVRIVRRDTVLAGTALRAGDVVVLLNGAANRDPARFEDAASFRMDRSPNRHLAFSAGIHFCIGAPLARIELAEALGAFLARFPDYRLVRDPVWIDNHTLRSPRELWIEARATDD